MKKVCVLAIIVLSLSGCAMNQKEQRALLGGGIGAGGGYLLGGPTGAVIGGLGGGVLGALTADDTKQVHHHYHGRGRGHRKH